MNVKATKDKILFATRCDSMYLSPSRQGRGTSWAPLLCFSPETAAPNVHRVSVVAAAVCRAAAPLTAPKAFHSSPLDGRPLMHVLACPHSHLGTPAPHSTLRNPHSSPHSSALPPITPHLDTHAPLPTPRHFPLLLYTSATLSILQPILFSLLYPGRKISRQLPKVVQKKVAMHCRSLR